MHLNFPLRAVLADTEQKLVTGLASVQLLLNSLYLDSFPDIVLSICTDCIACALYNVPKECQYSLKYLKHV